MLQALRFGETCASVEVAARGGAERQVQAALAAIDEQVAELRQEWGENALPEKGKSKLVLLLTLALALALALTLSHRPTPTSPSH